MPILPVAMSFPGRADRTVRTIKLQLWTARGANGHALLEGVLMQTMFTFAAVIGGAVLVFQFVLTMLGIGGDDGDLGGAHHGDLAGGGAHNGDFSAGHESAAGHHAGVDGAHSANWFYEILSIRTLAAGITFFGLTGNGALAWGYSPGASFVLAMVAGAGAMYGVYWLYKQVYRLQHSGTENIRNAIGAPAVVYVPIPAKQAGAGKVTFKLQNRLVEYLAVTEDESRLATGEKVLITAIVSPDTVRVARTSAAKEAFISSTTSA